MHYETLGNLIPAPIKDQNAVFFFSRSQSGSYSQVTVTTLQIFSGAYLAMRE